ALPGRGGRGLHAAPQNPAQRPQAAAHPRADRGLRGRSRCPRGDARAASIQHPGTGPRPRASVTLVFPAAVQGGLVMTVYRRILLVVDLTEGSVGIGRKAQALAAALGAEVELLRSEEHTSELQSLAY